MWISPEKGLLSAFKGSSFAFDAALGEELALSHRVLPSQIPWLLGIIYSSCRKAEAESHSTLLTLPWLHLKTPEAQYRCRFGYCHMQSIDIVTYSSLLREVNVLTALGSGVGTNRL